MDLEGSALGSVKKIARNVQHGRVDAAALLALSRHGGLLAQSLIWRYLRQRLYVPASVDFNVEICAEQAPHWDNAITLSEHRDSLGIPLARIDWEPKAADEMTLRVGMERLAKFWTRSGWDRVAGLTFLLSVTNPSTRLIDASVDYYHPSGTTRMGIDGSLSTVSGNLTSHHIKNLSILSASVFPRAGSANPTFTLMRMALRLSDHLANQISGNTVATTTDSLQVVL
jgi:choline dehydrogenase-like flavoprotein